MYCTKKPAYAGFFVFVT